MGFTGYHDSTAGLFHGYYQNRLGASGRSGRYHGKHCYFAGQYPRRKRIKVMNKIGRYLEKKTPEIEHYSRVAGYGFLSGQGTSYGLIVIRLRDWSERKG